jgi:hypothetical protein
MRAMVQHLRWGRVLLSILSLFFLSSVTFVSAAEQTTAASAKKPAKTKSTKKQAAPTLTEDVALASFETFTIEWMQKLAQTEDFHRTQAKVSEAAGGFAAEYTGYLPTRYITIKKTSSSDTPFVGILTYFEKRLRCTGKTKEEAMKGPFDHVETNQVSEIFRFTKGKWVY